MNLANYQTIIFDCDGVLIDSNQRKIDAFLNAMPSGVTPAQRTEYAATMARNFGKPRQWLLEAFAEICPQFACEQEANALLARYGKAVSEAYPLWPCTEGSELFLKQLVPSKQLYVASGSDQTELRNVFKQRGLTPLFTDVLGGPVSKRENLQTILANTRSPALFIGDSIVDFESAQECSGLDFVFYTPYSIDRERVIEFAQRHAIPMVGSFGEFQT